MSTVKQAYASVKWLIEEGVEFKGTTESILLSDGTVAYTDGLTLAQYEVARSRKYQILTNEELDKLMQAYMEGMKTDPTPITHERYWEMLEILPPCRWNMAGMWEVFHVSEHLYGNLVSWFATRKHNGIETYLECVDYDNISTSDLRDKFDTYKASEHHA